MSVYTSGKRASVLLLIISACSAANGSAPERSSVSTAAGSGSGAPVMGTDSGGSSVPLDNHQTDNPTMLAPLGNSGGAGGATVDAGDDADGGNCKSGTFCQSNKPDSTDCGHINVNTNTTVVQKPGNVLVVFDRSTSMQQDWKGTPKYQAAGNALIAALTPLKSLLTVGGLFFPSPASNMMGSTACPMGCDGTNLINLLPGGCCAKGAGPGCSVDTIDKPDEINFTTADSFIAGLDRKSVV
jgi:hypothetical protein